MTGKDKKEFFLIIIGFVLLVFIYFRFVKVKSAQVDNLIKEIRIEEKNGEQYNKQLKKLGRQINRWELTFKDLKELKKNFSYSLEKKNILRYELEKILNKSGLNPDSEDIKTKSLSSGFHLLVFKFNAIPRENLLELIENIKHFKYLVFISSLRIIRSPSISSIITIKGLLHENK